MNDTRHSGRATSPDDTVLLLDCDNTLLDNDLIEDDLREHLASEFGLESRDRYWAIFEQLRAELGYADYLGAAEPPPLDATQGDCHDVIDAPRASR